VAKDDRTNRKIVGKLIEVLHGEYSDTRDLAVVQLAILGSQAVPHICAFLKKEGDLERDFVKCARAPWYDDFTVPYPLSRGVKERKAIEEFRQYFEKKWGWKISYGDLPSRSVDVSGRFPQRQEAVDGALEALAIIGDPKAIPTLKSLPIYDWQVLYSRFPDDPDHVCTFEKAKETIDKIRSA